MKRLLRSLSLPLCLSALALSGSGCIVAAAAGAGYLVSREVLPDEVHTAQVNDDAERVFLVAQETLGFLIEPGTEVTTQQFPRVAKGKVDGADVTITIEAFDLDRTTIKVQAEKPLRHDGATANEVLNRILDRLKR